MKCQDFGQFLFNSSSFDDNRLIEIISAAKNIKPTVATAAVFLKFIAINNMNKEYYHSHEYDNQVQKSLNSRTLQAVMESVDEPSIKIAQVLVDGAVDFAEFEKILSRYYREEIPPVEKIFIQWYNSTLAKETLAYLPTLDIVKNFHGFLSESLKTTIIFSSTVAKTNNSMFGASVKIHGVIPVVVGVLAEKNVLHKLAFSYDKFATEDIEEDFDAVAEMLNVFTGNFAVRVATRLGVEEELCPPRFGQLEKNIETLLGVACDIGKFYLYIGEEEIFD